MRICLDINEGLHLFHGGVTSKVIVLAYMDEDQVLFFRTGFCLGKWHRERMLSSRCSPGCAVPARMLTNWRGSSGKLQHGVESKGMQGCEGDVTVRSVDRRRQVLSSTRFVCFTSDWSRFAT